jgi:AraC-like DNA-binding protein
MNKRVKMLAETDEKIAQVAFASGFRHLGFQLPFKKKLGITPGEWRRDNRSAERKATNVTGH